jgi:hypothetical protein
MARKKPKISAKLLQEEKDRIANPDRKPREGMTAAQEKLHNQLRKQRKSILAERKAQKRASAGATGGAGAAATPKPKSQGANAKPPRKKRRGGAGKPMQSR